MNRKFYQTGIPALVLAIALTLASCVNKDYKVEELNYEVQLAPNGVSLPLGTIGRETLGDLLENQDDLKVINGYYAFQYSDDAISFEAPGITVSPISDIGDAFGDISVSINAPEFDFSDGTAIQGLNLQRDGSFPGAITPGTWSGGVLTIPGKIESGNGKIEIDVALPTEIKKINTVWFGTGNVGSEVSITINPGGLSGIMSNLKVKDIKVVMPARYKLAKHSSYPATVSGGTDLDGKTGTANIWTLAEKNFTSGQTIEAKFYVESVDMSTLNIVNNEIYADEKFSYEINYELTTKNGDVTSTFPSALISGQPAFKDATFETNKIKIESHKSQALDYTIGGIPSTVAKISAIDLVDGKNVLNIKITDPNLPFKKSELPLVITFPSIFTLDDPDAVGNVLTKKLSAFTGENGYNMVIDKIAFSGNILTDDGDDKKIDLSSYKVDIDVDYEFGEEEFRWSTDIDGKPIPSVLSVEVTSSDIEIESVTVELDLPLDEYIADANIESIDLSELTKNMGDEEQHPDLVPPTITMMVSNSAGIEIIGNLSLDPKKKDGTSLGVVTIDDLLIEPAGNDGSVENTYIFIGQTDTTPPAGYTPYYADLDNLLNTLPTTIDVSLSAMVTPNKEFTIHVNEDFPFSLEYSVDLSPLAFGPDMNLVIEINEDGLNDTFSDLAEYQVKAADISVHAELTVSFPLKVKGEDIAVDFLDKDGHEIPGLKATASGKIEGPATEGAGENTSTLAISITVPDGGDFQTLSEVDQLVLRLPITGTSSVNRLRPNDYISGKVWLTLAEGISLDLDKL